jgi:hypothetical protein
VLGSVQTYAPLLITTTRASACFPPHQVSQRGQEGGQTARFVGRGPQQQRGDVVGSGRLRRWQRGRRWWWWVETYERPSTYGCSRGQFAHDAKETLTSVFWRLSRGATPRWKELTESPPPPPTHNYTCPHSPRACTVNTHAHPLIHAHTQPHTVRLLFTHLYLVCAPRASVSYVLTCYVPKLKRAKQALEHKIVQHVRFPVTPA